MNDYLHNAVTQRFGKYLVLTIRDVAEFRGKDLELLFTIPNLPPNLWKEYRQVGASVRLVQEVYEQPHLLDEAVNELIENLVRNILKAPDGKLLA